MNTVPQRIVPHLWFDQEAVEAAEFYAAIFPESRVTQSYTLQDTPSGDCDVVSFEVWGHEMMAISAGPHFRFNPSISFMVNFDPLFFSDASSPTQAAREKLDEVWAKLSDAGTELMPLDEYPFSSRYGWIQDRYGLTWQLIFTDPEGDPRPPIVPSLLFVGDNCGKAEAALGFYQSVFENTQQGGLYRYGPGQEPDREGTIMFADVKLENYWIAFMDSAHSHEFGFNEAVSFMVNCDDQNEIDYYWEKLSAGPEAEQCGWLKDPYGISWQIVPKAMHAMLQQGTPGQVARVTQAFLPMKKLELAILEHAFAGKQ